MKVTGISMVRNEADVIEAFVRHHAELVDEMVVIDHCSTDGTPDLLEALAAEGLPLSVRREGSLVQRQNLALTGLARQAAAGGADLVLPLDADEFLVAPEGDPGSVLRGLPLDRASTVELRYYVPCPDDPQEEANVLRRIRHRRIAESASWTRKVIFPAARAGDSSLSQGNHALVDERTCEYVDASHTEQLALAHFPVRTPDQLARKVLGAWPAHLARPDRRRGEGFQWERVFGEAVAGQLTPQRLQAIAFEYPVRESNGHPGRELVFDPVPSHFELRHEVPAAPAPLEVLARTAVSLAEELSEVSRRR